MTKQSPPRCAFFRVDDPATLADLMWTQWQQASAEPAPATGLSAGHGERRATFARRSRNIVAQALATPRSV